MTRTTEQIEWHGVPATRVTYEDPLPGGRAYKSVEVYVDGCAYCDGEKANGSTFFPSHFARDTCESGKHPHCTCDGCF
jgi:hypothetical protein